MGIREELQRRGQIPADEVDEVIAEAARLHEQDRTEAERHATREELAKVASELEVPDEYVERAIQKREQDRAARAAAEAERAAKAQAAAAARKKALGLAAATLGALLALLVVVGWAGSGAVREAAGAAATAEAQLDAVLARQASLAPQLVGMAGGSAGELSALADKVREAPDIGARMKAAEALSVAMAEALGRLPPPENEAQAQLRLNLQYEVTGTQNRITTEARRWSEAEARWEQAAASPTGRLAVAFGMADGPTRSP